MQTPPDATQQPDHTHERTLRFSHADSAALLLAASQADGICPDWAVEHASCHESSHEQVLA